MPKKLGKDEQTVFFAVKIMVPVVLSLLVAIAIDISSVAHGAGEFMGEVRAVTPSSY